MFSFTRYPIALSLILGLILVASLSFVASLYTLWMTTVLSGDAAAVNTSGSLRMQSYRIAFSIQSDASIIERELLLSEFESRLTSNELKGHIPVTDVKLSTLFASIENQFSDMRDYAINSPTEYLAQVRFFVEDIDLLVALLEEWSESKVAQLRRQQIVISSITLFAAALFAFVIFYRVVSPLQSLVGTVLKIGQGDRDARSSYTRNDEFGELSGTLNNMAQEIADAQGSLESQIAEQTKELSRNNQTLEFLFNLGQALSVERPDISSLKSLAVQELKAICHCDELFWTDKDEISNPTQTAIRCAADRSYLVCKHTDTLPDWQNRILETVGDLFDNAINRMGAHENENRIALLNERSAIARELHDSLAQQLSYLKIQVVRFVKLRERNADDETLSAIVGELREGLNTSYRKLRELLVTFRAQSEEPGLVPSVKAAADEINRISQSTKVHLYIDDTWPADLSPSHEMHCLHVIREALTNVIKHAGAENAVVSMTVKEEGQLEIKINDDGIGFSEDPEKPMHYGLKIMNERASRIGGKITYSTLNYGGAGVTLTFNPEHEKEEA